MDSDSNLDLGSGGFSELTKQNNMRVSQRIRPLAVLLAVPFAALAIPDSVPVALAASQSWSLFQIELWTANATTHGASYIDFLFQDARNGSQTNTECYRAAIPGNRHVGIDDSENYYPCADTTVSFKYNKGRIDIARSYQDPS